MQDEDHISLFALGTVLLRNRWRIVLWTLVGGVLAALSVISKPSLYSASLSFVPQGADVARSGLASLAGQLGISGVGGSPSQSPDFYVGLIKSRELLRLIVRDTFIVREMGGKRLSFLDLFEVAQGSSDQREEAAVRMLARMLGAAVVKNTGVVQVTVATRWPSVSLAIATAVLNGVNDYNIRTRQGQATEERKFVEGRLAIARRDLRAAEDRSQAFLSGNRGNFSSPQLSFERDRLQRDVMLQQQVFTTLTQAYDDVRIREARDTPSITIFEAPAVSTTPEPRGRAKRGLLGLVLGAMFGGFLALVSEMMARRKGIGDSDANEFLAALEDAKREVFGPLRRSRARADR